MLSDVEGFKFLLERQLSQMEYSRLYKSLHLVLYTIYMILCPSDFTFLSVCLFTYMYALKLKKIKILVLTQLAFLKLKSRQHIFENG